MRQLSYIPLVSIFLFFSACALHGSDSEKLFAGELNGKEFILNNMYQNSGITIGFDNGRVFGFSGVNRYMGAFKIDKGKIELDHMAATRMAGPEDKMNIETRYLQGLSGKKNISLKNGILKIGNMEFKEK